MHWSRRLWRPILHVSLAGVLGIVLGSCGEEGAIGSPTSSNSAGQVDFPRCDDLEEARSPAPDGPLSADPDVAAAQEWRADKGIRSDAVWVESLAAAVADPDSADPTLGEVTTSFQYPLTAQEAETYSTRSDEDVSIALGEYMADFPDTSGGSWFDHRPGGIRVVAFTNDVASYQAALDERFGPGEVGVVEVEHPAAELEALEAYIADLASDDLVLSASASYIDNLVAVELYPFNDSSERVLTDAFPGAPLCVGEGQATTEIDASS